MIAYTVFWLNPDGALGRNIVFMQRSVLSLRSISWTSSRLYF
jgi:hypothetical protein